LTRRVKMGMPPDPFGNELDDFLPMAKNARRMFEAAVVSGFTEAQAMEWMIRITSAMIIENIRSQNKQ
jgi:hypothetical protein